MRLIGELDDGQKATTFAAYLVVKGIDCQIDQEGDEFKIWVKDEDRFKESLEELEQFKLDPTHARYAKSVNEAKSLVREEEKKRKKIQKKIVKVGAGGLNRNPPLTLIFIIICVFVSIATDAILGRDKADHPIFKALQFVCVSVEEANSQDFKSIDDLGLRTINLRKGEIWRAVTPIFIHYGAFHLLFNMYMFFQFGKVIENRYGTFKYALLVLGIAIISNLVQCGVPYGLGGSPPGSTGDILITRVGGMSGVIYGLFGFFWMKSTYDRSFGYRISQTTVIILMAWFVFCMMPPEIHEKIGFGGNVANWAHGIGLLVGVIVGYVTSMNK